MCLHPGSLQGHRYFLFLLSKAGTARADAGWLHVCLEVSTVNGTQHKLTGFRIEHKMLHLTPKSKHVQLPTK